MASLRSVVLRRTFYVLGDIADGLLAVARPTTYNVERKTRIAS